MVAGFGRAKETVQDTEGCVCLEKNTWPTSAFESSYSIVPEGLFVCHSCDNPPCCNPEHLFLGTCPDNNADMREKKRHAFGEKHGGARLTNSDVRKIKSLFSENVSVDLIHKMFPEKTSRENITRIFRGERWRHVV